VLHRVVVPFQWLALLLQQVAAGGAACQGHHAVAAAVRLEHGGQRIGVLALGRGAVGQRQVARHAHQPRQALRVAQPRAQRDGAALREAPQHDAVRGHAALHLAVQQRVHLRKRLAQAGFVFAPYQIGAQDVVPGAHAVAAVDGDRPHWRARKHPAHRPHGGELHFVGKRQEVGAVGAQPVQDDDRRLGLGARVYFDGLQCHVRPPRALQIGSRFPPWNRLRRAIGGRPPWGVASDSELGG